VILGIAVVALSLAAFTAMTKLITGWVAAHRAGIGRPGRARPHFARLLSICSTNL